MKNNLCDKFEPLLFGYVDHSLDPKQVKKVEQHLQACEHCRNCLAELKQVNELLSEVKPLPSPAGLDARIREKIKNVQVAPITTLWRYTRWGVAAAIIFFVVWGVTLRNQTVITPSQVTLAPQRERDRLVLSPAIGGIEGVREKKTEIVTKKQVQSESVSIPSPLGGEGQGEVEEPQKVVNLPEIGQTQETQKIEKETKPTQQTVVNVLISQGVPVQNAQQTVKSAISRGYTVDKLNQIVTNPQSSTVSLSPKRTVQNQSGSFKFEEAVPNPFTPNGDKIYDEIFFKYQNPEGLTIKIKIYNLNDVVVRNLEFTAGEAASWNGTNDSGELVESGIYLYTLQAGQTIIRGTMILAK